MRLLPLPARLAPFALLAAAFCAAPTLAQATAATTPPAGMPSLADTSFHSHEVHADGSITLRLVAPAAKVVTSSFDGLPAPLTLTREPGGIWSVTTPPLPPEIYGYNFTVDGLTQADPLNHHARANYVFLGSEVEVHGTTPAPWDLQAVPHGRVDFHAYTTHVAQNLPVDQETYIVYTPPGYDARKPGGYPVLYLLHGWSDEVTGWTNTGREPEILDSLIAGGKAVPMIVVMPLGYGNFHFVEQGFGVWTLPALVDNNTTLYSQMLLTEIVPAVEAGYNIARGRDNTAIAGLSMGGLESLTIGVNHPQQFGWVGGFSAAVHLGGYDRRMSGVDPKLPPHLLWVSCGDGDGLLTADTAFALWADAHGLHPTRIVTPGRHEWPVWRDNLIHFAPLLFRPAGSHEIPAGSH